MRTPVAQSADRRRFIQRLVFGAEPAARPSRGHTLVVVFLRGGADTLNMLVPYGDDAYYRERPTLSIARPSASSDTSALRLTDFYALHPHMKPLVPAFFDGRLAFVQSVGSDNASGSHFSAQDQIEHGEQGTATPGGGWLGRHLRSRASAGTPLSAVAIGSSFPESLRGAPAASVFESLDELQIKFPRENPGAVALALSKLYGADVGVLADRGRETLELLERVQRMKAVAYVPDHGAVYPDRPFARGLREVARLIKADVGLDVACVDLGGWDTHFVQGSAAGIQADLIAELSESLAAFDADLTEHRDQVTTVVMTEFGRRLYENASLGTDHGRGFSLFLLGGQIQGGKIHGPWPGFEERGLSDADLPGPGGLKVEVDYRLVLAELLEKVVGNPQIQSVFPGLDRGYLGVAKG